VGQPVEMGARLNDGAPERESVNNGCDSVLFFPLGQHLEQQLVDDVTRG
jgi:hypothetical protein